MLPENGHARLDNAWLNALLPSLPIAEAIRLYLQAKGNLRQKGAGLGELMTATGDRDPRHTERAVKRLLASGLLALHEGRYYSPAYAPAQNTAATPANTSFSHVGNAVLDSENQNGKRPERREEGKEEKTDSPVGLEELDRAAAEPTGAQVPAEGQQAIPAPALPGTDEAHEVATPTASCSSEKDDQASREAEQAHPAPPSPPSSARPPSPPRAEYHGDDHDAVVFFHDLAGYGFVVRYRMDLARWHRDYSPDFLRLAKRLAPTLPGAKGIFTLADLLNQDPRKPWPPALIAQHRLDTAPAPITSTRPAEGETWTCRAGTGPVVEVNPRAQVATIQWGPEPGDVIELPWAAMQPARSA